MHRIRQKGALAKIESAAASILPDLLSFRTLDNEAKFHFSTFLNRISVIFTDILYCWTIDK